MEQNTIGEDTIDRSPRDNISGDVGKFGFITIVSWVDYGAQLEIIILIRAMGSGNEVPSLISESDMN